MRPPRELQAAFRQALLADDAAAVAEEIARDGLDPGARLQVYRNHVLTTLTAVLGEAYPVVARLVDARFFGFAADRYVRAQPPDGPCLFEYGRTFPDFLAGFPPCQGLPCLPDVARLEWALHVAIHADDAEPIDPAAIRATSPEDLGRLVLHPHPSVALVESRWPVDRIWLANQPDADSEVVVDLDAGGARLLVHRAEDTAGFRALDAGRSTLWRALLERRPLEDAAAAALAAESTLDLTLALRDLLREGLIVGATLSLPATERS